MDSVNTQALKRTYTAYFCLISRIDLAAPGARKRARVRRVRSDGKRRVARATDEHLGTRQVGGRAGPAWG